LNILPVDGTYHRFSQGENLEAIAQFFGIEPEAIIEWPGNRLDPYETDINNPDIADGTWLIIPGGQREIQDWGPPAITRDNPASAAYYGDGHCGAVYEGAIGSSTFIWPTGYVWLSGYDYDANVHPAIDIGGVIGEPIYAVDSGVVVYSGWSDYGYGYLIVVDHGNNWQSAYAHLSGVSVYCGQSVYQGDIIGSLGSTGNSSGPHLHFELNSFIYGKVNPWDFLIQP
jgi:murein DD-endopeptidase MepM/ murein hydrolase activator NlpD